MLSSPQCDLLTGSLASSQYAQIRKSTSCSQVGEKQAGHTKAIITLLEMNYLKTLKYKKAFNDDVYKRMQ